MNCFCLCCDENSPRNVFLNPSLDYSGGFGIVVRIVNRAIVTNINLNEDEIFKLYSFFCNERESSPPEISIGNFTYKKDRGGISFCRSNGGKREEVVFTISAENKRKMAAFLRKIYDTFLDLRVKIYAQSEISGRSKAGLDFSLGE